MQQSGDMTESEPANQIHQEPGLDAGAISLCWFSEG